MAVLAGVLLMGCVAILGAGHAALWLLLRSELGTQKSRRSESRGG